MVKGLTYKPRRAWARILVRPKCMSSWHKEESGLARPDCGARYASLIQSWRLINLKGTLNYRMWSKRRLNVYPQVKQGKIGHICKGPWSRHRLRAMIQRNRPHQSPQDQRHANERSRYWTPSVYIEGDCLSVRSLPIRSTTSWSKACKASSISEAT